ncbi:MAG: peptide-binding protein [Campylobacterales bacterium]|nr:peptide-binding protein [Campylobacterales bacterium]
MRIIFLVLLLGQMLGASTLHLAISSNPSRLNPLLATDSASSSISDFIFNALVKYSPTGDAIIGDLAERFYFENNTTLIFELRKGVKWHDGAPFEARDVVFTYELIHAPQTATPYTSTFRMVEKVEALDAHTVRVIYKAPYFKALETWMMGIVPYHLLKDEANIMSAAFNTAPIGTGPYRLSRLEHSKSIELEAFGDYFEGKPKIERISFHVIADPMTRFLKLKAGELDIGALEAMQFERQLDRSFSERFETIEQIAHTYDYLGFNLRLDKFKDPRVRRALSLAINRKSLADILFMKHARVCTGPFLPGGIGFDSSVEAPQRDLVAAKALLKEAGYDERHPLRFEIATSSGSAIRPYAAQIIQQQLAAIGVEVELRIMEWQAFLNMVVFPRQFEAVLLGWSLSLSPDPYLLWHSDNDKPGAFNFIGYHNHKVDQLIETVQSEVDRERISTLLQQIFYEIVQDNPYLFLYIPNSLTAIDRHIGPIRPTVNGIWHNQIEWEKSE